MTAERTEHFVRLLSQNDRKVYGYILALVPNWADADEIFQETNVRLWQQFDRYEPGTDFAAWACTVAYYQVLTHRKRVGRQKVQFSTEFLEAVNRATAAARPEADARLGALARCTEKLDPAARAVLELCYQRGLSIREAAVKLGRSAEGTYKALARIRLALHRCIEQALRQEDIAHGVS